MAVKDWSTTASTNATADSTNGINWSEGQAPSQVNDSARAMMAVIKGDFANVLSGSGYQKLPNGLILQWIRVTGGAGGIAGNWPITFPGACLNVQATVESPVTTSVLGVHIAAYSTANFNLIRLTDPGGSAALTAGGYTVHVFAVGA